MGFLRALRLPEAFLVAGFTFAGMALSAADGASLLTGRAALFLIASYLVIVSIYAFNSWAGFEEDLSNPRLALSPSISRRLFASVSLFTITAAGVLFAVIAPLAIPYALLVWFLWGGYSFPRRGAKYLPLAGTFMHLLVGMVQFHQGWMWNGAVSEASLLLSLYFALLLASGHLNHEAIDREADRAAGVTTGAVRFGLRRWAWVHLITVAASCAALIAASFVAAIPALRLVPFFAASAGHLFSAGRLVAGLDRDQLVFVRHRMRYRLLFGGAGIISLAALFA